LAASNLHRRAYGFEIKKNFYNEAKKKILVNIEPYFRFEPKEKMVKPENNKSLVEDR
jgi:hypothetical protein